jgi:hypothetical protein
MNDSIKTILEKLLPAKWWVKPALPPEQFWTAFANIAEDNPVYRALTHEATDWFMQNATLALDRNAPDAKRLEAAAVAGAFAAYLQRLEDYRAGALAQIERLEKQKAGK